MTIKTHTNKPVASSGVETASEWESDEPGKSGANAAGANMMHVRSGVSAVGQMGSNRMVFSSTINRDGAGGASAHQSHKWDTPRRVGGNFGATPRRSRWDVGQSGPGATPGGLGGGFGATPSRFSSLK